MAYNFIALFSIFIIGQKKIRYYNIKSYCVILHDVFTPCTKFYRGKKDYITVLNLVLLTL